MKAYGIEFKKIGIDPSWNKEPKPGVTIDSFAGIWLDEDKKAKKPKQQKAKKGNS
jgi:hypothetical protein